MENWDLHSSVAIQLPITGLLSVLVLLAACQPQADRQQRYISEEIRPVQESWDVRFRVSQVPTGSQETFPRMHVLAGYMANYEEEDSTYTLLQPDPDEPQGRTIAYLFTVEGDSSATLTADRFVYYEEERRLHAEGNVIVVTKDDRRLESEELIWLEEERSIRTPGFVRITTPEERVQGYNLVGDEDLSTYQLGRVTGQVTLEDDE